MVPDGGLRGRGRVSRAGVPAALLLALILPACSVATCQPARIVVVKKDERVKPGPSLSLRTTETGRIEEVPAPLVREYRVQAEDGTWYRVSAEQFERAEVGGALEICR